MSTPKPGPGNLTPGRIAALMAAAANLIHPYRECPECIAYAERRQDTLPAGIIAASRKHHTSGRQLLDDFMDGVHERHLDGLPI